MFYISHTRGSNPKRQAQGARHDHQTQSRTNISAAPLPAGAEARGYDQLRPPDKERRRPPSGPTLRAPRHHHRRRERYIIREPGTPAADRRFPDLLIAFGADPEAYQDSNSYVISEQGKPPDFVMEIASESTGQEDTGNKRTWYADLGIPEYWRFDQTGRFHGSRLAGDRLVDGRYEPIAIEEVEEGVLQGYSAALGLFVRWERGELRWHDPETGQEIPTFEQEREGRLAEREGRLAERDGRLAEQDGRLAAQARVRELEAELAQRQEEG